MTSFMALDGVTSFLGLKDLTITCKRKRCSLSIGGSSSVQWRKGWKKLKTSNVFSSFIVCKNRNRSAPVRELLRARDLIFFTTDLQAVNC